MKILKNRMAIGIFCIVISLVICFVIAPLISRTSEAKVDVVCAVKPIGVGEEITDDNIKIVQVGSFNLPAEIIKEKDKVIGKFAVAEIFKGDYLMDEKLTDVPTAGESYFHALDGSQQLMSITIKNFAEGVSGKLKTGDIITVIAPDYKQMGETVVLPELKYVEVAGVTAASGVDVDPDSPAPIDGTEKELPATVTLLVNEIQGKALAGIEADGNLHITLAYRGTKANSEKFLQAQSDVIAQVYPGIQSGKIEVK